ncbi:MAR-binding filament-like protein 1 [Striga hermonthica]|uniref:MAR-binding filament-like protein 1 n=1 Tax=Striga hermonthica TaxID=68872 RepID=A0A9N7NUS7_STRHE|nr:MAR-binding filament-like protein 1 [Striga hermonthica]
MGSCLNQSPFRYSQRSSRSPFPFRNAHTRRSHRTAMAYARQENLKDKFFCSRRLILFMGFAVMPIIRRRAGAIQALDADNIELKEQDWKEKEKESVQESSSRNSFFLLLNAIGFAVLAALYASTKKEKDAADATIESMKIKLNEKEAAIACLEEKFETELLNERETSKKLLAKENAEHLALSSQLKRANDTIKCISSELQEQKVLVKEHTFQAGDLESRLHGAQNEKTEIQEQLKEKVNSLSDLQERVDMLSLEIKEKEDSFLILKSKFDEKERDLDTLSFLYKQARDQVTNLNSEVEKLKDLLLEDEKELELKNGLVEKLKSELSLLIDEKNESSKKLDSVVDEYSQFRLSAEKKWASEAEIRGKKEEQICRLEEQINFSLGEIERKDGLISHLIKEKDNLQEMLELESKNAKNMGCELEITQADLEKSSKEASDLSEELKQSRDLCSNLEKKLFEAQTEFNEAKDILQMNILEMKQETENLSRQLRSAKELLDKSNAEIEITSQELIDAVQKCEILEKELNEEKNATTSLNEELNLLEAQVSKDKEFKKNLESDLDEADKALEEMNRNALILSRELEMANSRISELGDEKGAVFTDLDREKRAFREAQLNLEDAHSLVLRLGKEREGLEKRGRKLEEELASAKGEILRLRGEINSSKKTNNVQSREKNDGVDENGVRKKRVRRRRKV